MATSTIIRPDGLLQVSGYGATAEQAEICKLRLDCGLKCQDCKYFYNKFTKKSCKEGAYNAEKIKHDSKGCQH